MPLPTEESDLTFNKKFEDPNVASSHVTGGVAHSTMAASMLRGANKNKDVNQRTNPGFDDGVAATPEPELEWSSNPFNTLHNWGEAAFEGLLEGAVVDAPTMVAEATQGALMFIGQEDSWLYREADYNIKQRQSLWVTHGTTLSEEAKKTPWAEFIHEGSKGVGSNMAVVGTGALMAPAATLAGAGAATAAGATALTALVTGTVYGGSQYKATVGELREAARQANEGIDDPALMKEVSAAFNWVAAEAALYEGGGEAISSIILKGLGGWAKSTKAFTNSYIFRYTT